MTNFLLISPRSLISVVVLVPLFLHAQTYTDLALELGISHSNDASAYWGAGVSFADFNDDGLDDISICQKGQPPLFYQNNGTGFDPISNWITITSEVKSLSWVDFDNDGDKDLFLTCYNAPYHLYRRDGENLVDISTEAGFISTSNQTFGHSWGDYNSDGFLDVYINNYNYFDGVANQFYENNGDGTFTEKSAELGIDNGPNFSFQSLWIDFDEDGDQDLFIINDRQYSKNYMYQNNGGTSFTDVTDAVNLGYIIFSMTSSAGDYDNDGDLDIYVTNNPTGHLLHQQQDDHTFVEVADAAGVATYDMGWAAQWMDYNLDGWQDLHVNCSPFWTENGQNKFYVNNQDGTFTYDISMGFDPDESWSHSSAVSDYNNDGIFDIFIVNDAPYKSSLWTSTNTTNNHYLKVRLAGTISNRDGVGSIIRCYTDTLAQMRHTYCGEGYMSQNSFTEIFGLGQHTLVDSLTVQWLSGHTDVFYNIEVDQLLEITEGSSLTAAITLEGENVLCPGDSLLLSAPPAVSYLWSTGDTTSTIYISDSGMYSVVIENELGFVIESSPLEISASLFPEFDASVNHVACFGDDSGAIELITDEGNVITWWNDSNDSTMSNLEAGNYSFTITNDDGCSIQEFIEVNQPDSLWIDFEMTNPMCFGESSGSINYEAVGGTSPYTFDTNFDPETGLTAGTYEVTVTDSLQCSALVSILLTQPEVLNIDVDVIDANGALNGSVTATFDGGTPPVELTVLSNQVEMDPNDLPAGTYQVSGIDANGCDVQTTIQIINLSAMDAEITNISIYPNPVTGDQLTINCSQAIVSTHLYNARGELVSAPLIQHGSIQIISTAALENGIYVLQMTCNDQIITQKIEILHMM